MPCMHARLQGTSPACCHIIHPFAPCNPFPSVTPKGGVLSYLLWPLCIRWHLAPVRLGGIWGHLVYGEVEDLWVFKAYTGSCLCAYRRLYKLWHRRLQQYFRPLH